MIHFINPQEQMYRVQTAQTTESSQCEYWAEMLFCVLSPDEAVSVVPAGPAASVLSHTSGPQRQHGAERW